MDLTCPICKSSIQTPNQNNDFDGSSYKCNRCGDFAISSTIEATLPNLNLSDVDVAKISHAIRQACKSGQKVSLDFPLITEILKLSLPNPSEQADLLIRWLGEQQTDPGKSFTLLKESGVAIIGALSIQGFEWILCHLVKSGLVGTGSNSPTQSSVGLALTFDGWRYFEKLKISGKSYRKAFMAMKFGDETLDWMLENVFKPSVAQTGFQLNKLDDQPRAGLIDNRLRVDIQSSDFLIADLTHDNHGAYWEAGYAEGIGKSVIYTCEKNKFCSEKTHFDTNHHLTILWNKESWESTCEQLKATIRATLPHVAKMSD